MQKRWSMDYVNRYIETNNKISQFASEIRKSKNMNTQRLISAIEAKYGKPLSDTYVVVLAMRENLRSNGSSNHSDSQLAMTIMNLTSMDWGSVAMKIRYGVWDKVVPVNPKGSIQVVNDGC